jgi:hypothetical protein
LEHQARKKKKKKVTIQSKNCIYISNIYVFKPMLIGYYTQGHFFNDDQDISIVVQNMYSAIFL